MKKTVHVFVHLDALAHWRRTGVGDSAAFRPVVA
jgi:hypothetical protein